MRIVLDCNVVIAAARTDGLCRRAVLAAVRWCEIVVSAEILAEYREVAQRPKHAASAEVAEVLIDEIEQIAILVAPAGVRTLPDPDDGVYLAAAVEGQAGVLVTGNRRHFPAELFEHAAQVVWHVADLKRAAHIVHGRAIRALRRGA